MSARVLVGPEIHVGMGKDVNTNAPVATIEFIPSIGEHVGVIITLDSVRELVKALRKTYES